MENFEELEIEGDEPVEIQLGGTAGLIAWISEADVDIAGWGWRSKKVAKNEIAQYYAMTSFNVAGVKQETYLHNLIWERMMDASLPRGFLVDHINGDKLDNRRSNLRLATRSDNEANKKKRRGKTTSKYKGVTKIGDGRKKCWRVSITVEKTQHKVGTFYDEKEAAKAYNKAALEQWGDFAYLNEIEEDDESN